MHKLVKSIVFAGVSLAALSATAKVSSGQGPVLKIGGSLTAMAVRADQSVRYQKETSIASKGNIMFNVGAESNNGLTYGGAAILELDRAKSTDSRISEAYVYVNHRDTGTFLIGDVNGPEKTMMYSASDVFGGNGGTGSSDLSKYVNTTVGVDYNTSIAPSNDTASKVVYLSPSIHGFQLGLAFTPNTGSYGRLTTTRYFSAGSAVVNGASSKRYTANQFAAALAYNTALQNDMNVGVYLAGTTGEGRPADQDTSATAGSEMSRGWKVYNENQWQIGTLIDYRNFQFGASYFDKGRSLMRTDRSKFRNTEGYNAAVGYNLASHTNVAVGYTHTERKVTAGRTKADVTTLTLDHVVVPGLVLFGEVDFMNLKTPQGHLNLASATGTSALSSTDLYDNYPSTNKNNRATVVMAGTKIRF